MYIVHWGGQILKFLVIIKSAEKNKKNQGIREFFTQNQFLRKSIVDIDATLKQITVDTCNFH